ncbi:hypothetical protein [Agromyces archimandritae]|uniref:Alternate-type signal peptide domain-containing protein n=1 Tax=Agromyces archimandritae TaxID=2781962 RepID=A0A975FKM6_9MICO|nr:hypothetical protein [Agromyces archimandritae]QTX03497.1 hypothetical protein G127AT_09000 [Agromyces archimandritae]
METPNTQKSAGKKRILLAGGAVLAAGALATAAAFTDFANLNLGTGADGSGIGGDNRFNIQVVGTDAEGNPEPGTWQEANTAEGVDILVPGADTITPGDTVSVEIPFRNESPKLSADIAFSIQEITGKTSGAGIRDALRYTVLLDGEDVDPAGAHTLASTQSLDLGQFATGEQGVIELEISLPDQGSAAANNALNGQTAYVQAHFDATSVTP